MTAVGFELLIFLLGAFVLGGIATSAWLGVRRPQRTLSAPVAVPDVEEDEELEDDDEALEALSRELGEAREALARSEASIKEHSTELAGLRQREEEREGRLREALAARDAAESTLATVRQELEQGRAGAIAAEETETLRAHADSLEQQLVAIRAELAEQTRALETRTREAQNASARASEMTRMESAAKARDKELAGLRAEAKQTAASVTSLRGELERAQQLVARGAEQAAAAERLRQELSVAEQARVELQARLAAVERSVTEAQTVAETSQEALLTAHRDLVDQRGAVERTSQQLRSALTELEQAKAALDDEKRERGLAKDERDWLAARVAQLEDSEVAAVERGARIEALAASLAEAQSSLAEAREARDVLVRDGAALTARLSWFESQQATAVEDVARAQSAQRALEAERDEARREAQEAARAVDAAVARAGASESAEARQRETAVEHLAALTAARGALAAVEKELETQRGRAAELEGELASIKSRGTKQEQEFAALRRKHAAVDEQRRDAAARADVLAAGLEAARAEHDAAIAKVEGLTVALAESQRALESRVPAEQLQALDRARRAVEEEMSVVTEELAGTREMVSSLETQLAAARLALADLEQLRTTTDEQRRALETTRAQLGEKDSRIAALEESEQAARSQASAAAEVHRLEVARFEVALADAGAANTVLESERQALRTELDTLTATIAGLEQQLQQRGGEAVDARARHDALLAQHDSLGGAHEALKVEHAVLRARLDERAAEHQALQTRVDVLGSERDELRQRCEGLGFDQRALSATHEGLRQEHESLRARFDALGSLHASLGREAQGLLADRARLDAELAQMTAAVEGERSQLASERDRVGDLRARAERAEVEAETLRGEVAAAASEAATLRAEAAARVAAEQARSTESANRPRRHAQRSGAVDGTSATNNHAVKSRSTPGAPKDDLTAIDGIGPVLERLLNRLGVVSFRQIAAWSREDIARVDEKLGSLRGRIVRDRWVQGAKRQHYSKYGERL